MRPRLLDLFCGAGGCSVGYHRAGFDVVGVDSDPKVGKHYPFEFICADAMTYPLAGFDVVAASPPCQDHSPLSALVGKHGTFDLLDETRQRLQSSGIPYVIENVMGAAMHPAIVLCGSMFGLRVYRHRQFEIDLNFLPMISVPSHPKHRVLTSTKKRRTCWDAGLNISVTGDIGSTIGGPAMGIDWMNGNELSQAIPPAYTEFIGAQLLDALASAA